MKIDRFSKDVSDAQGVRLNERRSAAVAQLPAGNPYEQARQNTHWTSQFNPSLAAAFTGSVARVFTPVDHPYRWLYAVVTSSGTFNSRCGVRMYRNQSVILELPFIDFSSGTQVPAGENWESFYVPSVNLTQSTVRGQLFVTRNVGGTSVGRFLTPTAVFMDCDAVELFCYSSALVNPTNFGYLGVLSSTVQLA